MTPIEKKVSTKKITRKPLASPIAATSGPEPTVVPNASARVMRKVATKPRMNFGKCVPDFALIGRGDRGEIRPRADEPARIGDHKHGREGRGEPLDVVAEQVGGGGQNGGENEVGDEERARAAEARIGFRDGRQRRGVGPD